MKQVFKQWKKKRLFHHMRKKHERLRVEKSSQRSVKVVFLVIFKSVWKLDTVFKKMQEDPFFEPVILVCPYTKSSEEIMWSTLTDVHDFFVKKNYPVRSSYDQVEGRWLDLKELGADVVFFTNPYGLTRPEYYKEAYLNYLSCYANYGYNIANFGSPIPQFNQKFHNALWLNFATDPFSYRMFCNESAAKGANTVLSGSPTTEALFDKNDEDTAWQVNDGRKRIIFAPHHTIEEQSVFKLANFIRLADFMKAMAEKYAAETCWSFKPHPLLKAKLYNHEAWGKNKTDAYYGFWKENENCQLDEGDYTRLFQQSDAMIHDSGSFMVEYLTQKKPVLFLRAESTVQSLNKFGQEALNACKAGSGKDDIESFVVNLINGGTVSGEIDDAFYRKNFSELYEESRPSRIVCDSIKQQLKGKK